MERRCGIAVVELVVNVGGNILLFSYRHIMLLYFLVDYGEAITSIILSIIIVMTVVMENRSIL